MELCTPTSLLSRLIVMQDARGSLTRYQYDAVGNRTKVIDANNQTITYTYDALDRNTQIDYGTSVVTFEYDQVGNRKVMTDSLGVTRYVYDELNRLKQVTDPFTGTVQYRYDPVGNRTQTIYPDGKGVTTTFDAANRLTGTLSWDGQLTTYQFDKAGRLITTTLPNDVQTISAYDDANRTTRLTHTRLSDGVVLGDYQFVLDAVGNRVAVTETARPPADGGGQFSALFSEPGNEATLLTTSTSTASPLALASWGPTPTLPLTLSPVPSTGPVPTPLPLPTPGSVSMAIVTNTGIVTETHWITTAQTTTGPYPAAEWSAESDSTTVTSGAAMGMAYSGTDILALWNMDEGAGTSIADSSGFTHTGTIYGAAWTNGLVGKALRFDGIDDYASVPDDPALEGMPALTVMAWVKSDTSVNPSQHYTILAKGDNTYRLVVGSTGKFSFHLNTSAGLFMLDSEVAFNATDWFFVVGTYDGATCRLYLNGQEAVAQSCSGTVNTNNYALWMGNNSQYTWRRWKGIIDQVALYQRAWTASEIQSLYANRVGQWNLDEGSGSSVVDASGNGHTGTVTGATWTTGISGAALRFASNSDRVAIPDHAGLDDLSTATVLAWVKSDTTTNPSQFYTILAKGDDTYRLVVRDTGTFEFHLNTDAGLFRLDSGVMFNATDWFFVVGTYDGATCKIYINGQEKASQSCSGTINANNYALWIGNNSQYTWRGWKGIIDQVALDRRPWSAAEIQARYASAPTVITYGYDPLYRLTEATYSTGQRFQYVYDAVGNRTVQTRTITNTQVITYQYDNANRMTKAGGVTYTWDNNGNLINDGSALYRYDRANRLISTTLNSATSLFNYNGDGVRLKQIVAGVVTTYTQDLVAPLPVVLQDEIQEPDVATVVARYLYGMGTRPLAQMGAYTDAWEYLLPDALGSVRQIVDANGNVTLAKSYEPYGTLLTSTGTASSIFAYAGEQIDTTGLIYLRARYMQPRLGIFLARDPWSGDVMQPWTFNGFNYATGNPVNLNDPSGFQSSGLGIGYFGYCFNFHTFEPLGLGPKILGHFPLGAFITAQQAVNICRAAYSQANWGYVPARGFDFASDLPKTAHDLFGWFVYDYRGNHTDWLYFDANQPLTQELAKTGEIDQIRSWYYSGQLHDPGIREYQFDVPQQIQAVMDVWKSMNELSVSISMLVGSFWYQAVPLDNGARVGFRIDNDTTLSSGSHVVGRYESGKYFVNSVEQLIERDQSLASKPIAEIIRDERYQVISILRNRTKDETGGQGGGNLYQTYYWTEEYDCVSPSWWNWWSSWGHDYQVWGWSDFKAKTMDPPGWPAQ
jgi:RHS repeat-associated protein